MDLAEKAEKIWRIKKRLLKKVEKEAVRMVKEEMEKTGDELERKACKELLNFWEEKGLF